MKKFLLFTWEVLKIVILAALIVVPIRYFLFQPFIVRGSSMEPNFYSGDYLIIDEISYRFENPERGEVIVFRYPRNPSQRFIKRIIGLPGETVEIKDNKIAVYSSEGEGIALDESEYLPGYNLSGSDLTVKLDSDNYFVLGDNRNFSSDSRKWGPIEKEDIIGKVYVKLFPFSALAKVEVPSY